jgi:hypothetical protein
MTEYRLAYDIARCVGNGRDECNTCLRKLVPGHPTWQVYMGSWALDGPCESRIPVNEEEK